MHLSLSYPLLKGCDILIFLQRSTVGNPQHQLINLLPYYDHVRNLHLCFVQSLTSRLTTYGSCLSSYTVCLSFVKTVTLINL